MKKGVTPVLTSVDSKQCEKNYWFLITRWDVSRRAVFHGTLFVETHIPLLYITIVTRLAKSCFGISRR